MGVLLSRERGQDNGSFTIVVDSQSKFSKGQVNKKYSFCQDVEPYHCDN